MEDNFRLEVSGNFESDWYFYLDSEDEDNQGYDNYKSPDAKAGSFTFSKKPEDSK